MSSIAYRLFWNMKHIKGTVYDATPMPFDGDEYVCGWVGTEYREVPRPVLFEADFKVTRHSDYPCNDFNWPIMSPRMLAVLRGLGDFPHRRIPVRLVDRRTSGAARYSPDGSLRPDVIDDRFAAVQLTEHIDVVDWERSSFKPGRINPKSGYFTQLVLREPAGGLPPLFRLAADASMLLVSAKARRALEGAGIRGIDFLSIPGARRVEVAS